MGKNCFKKNIIFSFLAFLLIALFLSCSSDSDAKVSGVDSFVVFDYEKEDSLPVVRLTVFAQTSSDVHRVERIKILNRATDYEWTIYEPMIIESEKRQWAGACDFVCPDEMNMPTGFYTLTYTDAQENEVEAVFSISYPYELLGKNAVQAEEFLSNNMRENVALYDENDILIYYGIFKDMWKTGDRIFSDNTDCTYYRRCLYVRGNSAVCLMPAVYKDAAKHE